MEAYIRVFIADKQNKWLSWLHLAEWWYNSTYHTFAKLTPFQALYGYVPPRLKEIVQVHPKVPALKIQSELNHKIMQVLKDNLTMTQNHMKQQAYQHRT